MKPAALGYESKIFSLVASGANSPAVRLSATLATLTRVAGASEPRVLAEQVKSLYGQLPLTLTGATVGSIVLVVVLLNHVPHTWLFLWLGILLANHASRLVVLARFRRTTIDASNANGWALWWLLGSMTSGILFGIAGFTFFAPDRLFEQVALIVILFVMCAGAVPLLATFPASLYTFLVPALTQLAGRLALEGGAHGFIGLIVLIAMGFTLFLGRHYGRVLHESISVRFENNDLITLLSARTREAEDARHLAEHANRSKTQFFAAASHDLRQPLHALGLFAAALRERATDPRMAEIATAINSSVEALENLFNELLDISKIDAGVVQPQPQHFALQRLFSRLRSELEPQAEHQGLRLRFVPTAHHVHTDPVLLERIVRNLVSNAIRYTHAGGVIVGARARAGRVWLEVWDTGIGIAPAEQARIFEEFYQAGNPERDRRKGLGLGLAIVRRLAGLLEAPLSVESRAQRGSVFKVGLPRGAIEAAIESVPSAAMRGDLHGQTVLIIDDEPSIRAATALLFSGWGAHAITAGSLAEALIHMAPLNAPPALIIADHRLRDGETGVDAINAVRNAAGYPMPAILLTGSSTPDVALAAQAIGAHFLAKPVNPAKLRALAAFKFRERIAA